MTTQHIKTVEQVNDALYHKYNVDICDMDTCDSDSVCSSYSYCELREVYEPSQEEVEAYYNGEYDVERTGKMVKDPHAEYSSHLICPMGHKISCLQRQMYEEHHYYTAACTMMLCDKCKEKHMNDYIELLSCLVMNTKERLKKNKNLIKEAGDEQLLMLIHNIECYNYLVYMRGSSRDNNKGCRYGSNIHERTLKKSKDICIHNIEYYLYNITIHCNPALNKLSKYQTLLNTPIVELV